MGELTSILVLDDEMAFLKLAKRRLTKAGVISRIRTATTGDEVVALVKAHPEIRMILFDQDVAPTAERGSDICRLVREELNGSKVLGALTSSASLEDREAFRAAGADFYCPKAALKDIAPGLAQLSEGYPMDAKYAKFIAPPLGFYHSRIIAE